MEDYLEVIALLKHKRGIVKVTDISQMMRVKKPSVTGALNMLSRYNLVVHEPYGYVELTLEGAKIARETQKRHNLLTKFLGEVLKIDLRIAEQDACKIEHSISTQTFEKLTKFIKFVETCPEGTRPQWLKSFDQYYETGCRFNCKTHIVKSKK